MDEKNMRWGLNRFFYTKNRNSLMTAYTMLLKARYCDDSGALLPEYPSIHQFRYFEKKYRKQQTYYITRQGLKDYQKNHRALLGDGIQAFAPAVGVGMLDATICDIFLVNDSGELVGRPILTACIDAYSGLCCGYSLSWEGGVYSLRGLMLNVITDKVGYCRRFGINIQKDDWDCDCLPATMVTDMGSEYQSENFEQIAELGVTVVNLPPYRPELKGSVEKFFDLVQGMFKPYLKGKGVIKPDFQERGAHDYRKDACLTMEGFEKILLHCIIYYNSERITANFPLSKEMLDAKVSPHASSIWLWGKKQAGANLIPVSPKQLILTLLPRTTGQFGRYGLKVNGLRYRHDDYTERYLNGGECMAAYNPEDVSCVWLLENGFFTAFSLIESQYKDKTLAETQDLRLRQKALVKVSEADNLQARLYLADHIETIAQTANQTTPVHVKQIRRTRKREQMRTHMDYMKAGAAHD